MKGNDQPLMVSPSQRSDWKDHVLSVIEPARTALAVIDVQNDFCSPSGALATRGSNVAPCMEVADKIVSILPRLRSLLNCIAFFRLVYDPSWMSPSQQERLLVNGRPSLCATEGDGTEFFRVTPADDDLVFVKHRYSAFSVDAFKEQLRLRDIATVLVAGVDTHICVESTVRHGYDLGFRMVVLSDLVGTRHTEMPRHLSSLEICNKYFGVVVTTAELLRATERR